MINEEFVERVIAAYIKHNIKPKRGVWNNDKGLISCCPVNVVAYDISGQEQSYYEVREQYGTFFVSGVIIGFDGGRLLHPTLCNKKESIDGFETGREIARCVFGDISTN